MSVNLSKLLGRQDALTLRAWGQREGKTYDALVCLVDSYLTLLKESQFNRDAPKPVRANDGTRQCVVCRLPRAKPRAGTGLYLDDAHTTEEQLLARMLMAHAWCPENVALLVAREVQAAGFVLGEKAQRALGVDRVDRRKDWLAPLAETITPETITADLEKVAEARRVLEVRAYDWAKIDPGCYCMGRKQCAPCLQRAGVRVLLHTGWRAPQIPEEDQ